jgi:putative DNA primase/helicase
MPDENTVARLDRERRLRELADMRPIEYHQARKEAAQELGLPLGVLDAEVKALKRDIEDDDLGDMPVEEINAWDAPVEGAALYAEVKDAIERHMDMPEGASTIVATWVFGTYCFDEFGLFPKLLISSPEKECGKSTLMEVIEALTYRGYLASNGTEAAIFRLIDAFHPALLLDETDRWVTRDKPGLIGIVNCGHTRRGAKVLRTVGDDHTPKNFSVWGPMALAGIRKPDDTIVSRSVEVELKRMPPGTRKEKVPIDLFQRSLNLRRKILRWYEDDGAGLHNEGLVMPDGGGDRTRDNWSVLLKIASRLGVLDCLRISRRTSRLMRFPGSIAPPWWTTSWNWRTVPGRIGGAVSPRTSWPSCLSLTG